MSSPPPIAVGSASALFHHRWNVRVLATLDALGGASRVAVLTHELSGRRSTTKASIDSLVALGLVEPNSGYGHPLRPEFVLTRRGRRVAPVCAGFVRAAERLDLLSTACNKWTAPVLASVDAGSSRFSLIRSRVDAITPRALTACLKELTARDLLMREVFDDYPPSVRYRLTRRGGTLGRAAAAIVRAL